MRARRMNFIIAILLSIADIWVTAYSGSAIWQVWSGIPRYRVSILLLAGIGSFTLADIWVKTLAIPPSPCSDQSSDAPSLADPLPGDALEGADV